MSDGDVSALVLSIGEPYTDRALSSLQRQTVAVADTVMCRGVAPFHAAVNAGAARVRTPFFIQVDADMVLDDVCVESLRAAMAPAVGVVVGRLRDPLLGRIVGVKLYRTACLREAPLPGSVSPDSDAVKALRQRGWTSVHALRQESQHTFGRHEPDYTVPYTYTKFLVTGARHHYRRNGGATRKLFQDLCRSEHPLAPLATAAVAHGLFLPATGDLLDAGRRWPLPPALADFAAPPAPGDHRPRCEIDAGATALDRTGADAGRDRSSPPSARSVDALAAVFRRAYDGGRARAQAGPSAGDVRAEWARLGADWSVSSWVSAVGFLHGLLSGETEPAEGCFARLAPLLAAVDRGRR